MKKTKSDFTQVEVQITPSFIEKVSKLNFLSPMSEWAGKLFYKKVDDVITLVDIFPMCFAKGMNFETNAELYADDLMEYLLDNDLMDYEVGLIHSHCNAGVFFSPTDFDELKESSDTNRWYLSVITNNKLEFIGKYVILSTTTRKITEKKVVQNKVYINKYNVEATEVFETPIKIVKLFNTHNEYGKIFEKLSKTTGTPGNNYSKRVFSRYGEQFNALSEY